MTEQEKMMIEKLAESEKNIAIPENLSPDNIEKRLKEKTKKPWWKQKRTYGMLAASMVLILGLGIFGWMNWEGEVEQEMAENVSGELKSNNALTAAASYEEIAECIENYQVAIEKTTGETGIFDLFGTKGADAVMEEAATEAAVPADGASAGTGSARTDSAAEFSDTNVRTEGVGEADIIKSDGKYLYVMKESCMDITIIDVSSDRMKEVSKIRTENGAQISQFYVKGTQMFLFTNISKTIYDEDGVEVYLGMSTQVETYDISNINQPKVVARTEQSGRFQTSRIVGDYIYTFSRYDVYDHDKNDDLETYIPTVNGKVLAAEAVYLPVVPAANQYVVVTSMHMDKPGEIVDEKAVLTEYGECYVSTENIYIYESSSRVSLLRTEDQPDGNETDIRKLSYKNGKLSGEAQGSVSGWIKDSFCIDEYKGNLRVVTTENGKDFTTNSVFVLDGNLDIIGEINGIAKDERIYSARLYGDTGYFVTYKEVDPLFSVDFSDPTNPQIIGQLKIPGFSEYLHFYGEGKLLGIGMDTEEKTGITNGLKLSMFDISDPTNVTESNVYVIEDVYSSDVFWDYKAVMIDYEKNMIGFSGYGRQEEYFIFEYTGAENGFTELMREEVNGTSYMATRGLFVGERYFVIKGNAIESYRMGTFEKIDDILI